jgi:hypothetical protein
VHGALAIVRALGLDAAAHVQQIAAQIARSSGRW